MFILYTSFLWLQHFLWSNEIKLCSEDMTNSLFRDLEFYIVNIGVIFYKTRFIQNYISFITWARMKLQTWNLVKVCRKKLTRRGILDFSLFLLFSWIWLTVNSIWRGDGTTQPPNRKIIHEKKRQMQSRWFFTSVIKFS